MTTTKHAAMHRIGLAGYIARLLAAGTLAVALTGCGTSSADLKTAEGQMRIGSKAAREGLWREAMFRYQRAIQIEPNNAMALSNLGVAYESSGDFEKARESYLKALQIDRANPYIQKNYSRFSEFYAKFKKREPKVLDAEKKDAETKDAEKKEETP